MVKTYDGREHAIKKCVSQVSEIVNNLHRQKKAEPDNGEVTRKLSKERTKVSFLQLVL